MRTLILLKQRILSRILFYSSVKIRSWYGALLPFVCTRTTSSYMPKTMLTHTILGSSETGSSGDLKHVRQWRRTLG